MLVLRGIYTTNITMKKVVFLCIVFIYNSNALFSQSQICPTSLNPWQWKTHSKWFHGEGNIITFPGGTGAPVGSATPTAGTYDAGSYESTASVCDENGNLLFYTNGERAFDKTGATLSSGLLTGNENGGQRGSAVQGVMIVKHPLNINEYYVFTTDDAVTATTKGFNYFIYNKLTNTMSGATRLGNYRCTEQVAATWHANGIDIWVTTHKSGSADLYSYLLKCSGISNPAAPVISSNVVLNAKANSDNERSCLKFSWGGTKAAATAHLGSGTWDPTNAIVLLDFNKTTGAFTKSAAAGVGTGGNVCIDPYACEFSTDDSKLYVDHVTSATAFYLSMAGWGNGTTIANSKTTVTGVAGLGGHLKIGGDGRMYKSGVIGTIGVISGTTYTASAVTSPQTVTYSLPNMFVPPQDYLKVRDTTVKKCHNLNMGVMWKCKGTDAEDLTTANWSTVNPAHSAYITDKKTGAISASTPAGTVMKVIYTICTISDTADVTITACGCPLDVKNESLKICIGNKVKMDTTVLVGPGIWTIDSVPTTTGTTPTLVIAGGDTTFTTVTGNKIGKYKLLLKDAGDATCRDSIYITVNPLPVPVITPATKTICQGDNAVTFDAGTFASYLWSVNGSGIIQTTSGKTAGRYKVQVTDANGCSDTTSAVLTVKTKPVVSFINDSICAGGSAAIFDAGTSYLGTNFQSYNWDNGFASSQKLSTTAAGKHEVFVSDVNGCKDTASAFLIIKNLPVAKVANQSICIGKSATFDGVSGTGRTFTWTGPSAFSSSSQQITVFTAGTYTLKVDSNKCSATVAPILTVNALPTPVIAPATKTICQGDNAASFDAGSYVSYVWSVNGTGTLQTTSGKTAGRYKVAVTDANGCSDTTSALLVVKTKPVVTFGNDSICPGDPSATFDAGTSYLSTNFVSYNWDNGFAASQKLQTTAAGKHEVFVSDVNGCKDTASAFLIIKSLPVAKVANQIICKGQTATFNGVAGTGRTFSWTGPSAFASTAQQITVSGAGTYTLKVDSNKCSATVAPILTVNNHAKPAVKDTTVCLTDLPVVLDATAGYTTYNWDNGTGALQTYSTSVAGSHSIYVTDGNGCKDTASIKITTIGQFVPAISVTLLQQTVCQNAAPFAITKGVGTSAGGKFFATCGSCVDQNTGIFNPALGRVIKPDTISYGLQSHCGDTASVYIQVLPVFTSVLSANKSLCPNEKYTIPATGWSPVDPQTLSVNVVGSWKFVGAGSGLNAATGVFDAAIAGVGVYKITYGLDAPIYPCYVPDTMTISVVALPTATITGDSTVCANVAGVQLAATGGTWWDAQGKINSSGYFSANGATVSTYPIEYRLDNGTCKDTVLYQVRVKKVPLTDFSGDKLQGCAPMTTLFTDESEEVPSTSFWTLAPNSTAATKGPASHTYGTPGKYNVSLQNTYSNGCVSAETKTDYLNVLAIPTVDFTSTPAVLSTMNPLASFSSSTSSDVTSMLWNFSTKGISVDATIANPDAIFSSLVDDTIPVQLMVSNGFCADSIKHNVILRTGTTIFVPNAFSPNGDDINEEFLPRGINMGDNGYEFMVFDRWGEVIFKTNNATEGWKGKRDNNMHDAQIDVYIWRVTYVDHFTGIKQEPLVGHVALLR